jgi:hypothetical protein
LFALTMIATHRGAEGMRFRAGIWLVAFAACAAVLVRVLVRIVDDAAGSHVAEAIAPSADLLLGVIAGAGVAIAGRARAWWLGAALAFEAPPLLLVMETWTPRADAVIGAVPLVGIVLFAAGALAHGSSRRLAIATVVIGSLFATMRLAGIWPPNWPFDAVVYIFPCLVALDLLAAFPIIAPALPVAAVRSHAGRVAVAISLAFLLAGITLCATAFELATERDVNLEQVVGTACIVAGVLGLWRLGGRAVWIPIVVVLDISVFTVVSLGTNLTLPALDDIPLQGRALPGFAISLPEGTDRGSEYHEVGRVDVQPKLPGVAVTVRWGFREQPVLELDHPEHSTTLVESTLVHTAIARDGDDRVAYLTWSCASGSWALVHLTAKLRDLQMREPRAFAALTSRIARSVHCFPYPVLKPAYALRFSRADHVAVPLADHVTRYDGPGGERLIVAWDVDVHSAHAAQRALAMLGDVAGQPRYGILEVDGDLRNYREVVAGGQRTIVTAWSCDEATWAARFDGPDTVSREAALDVMRAALCP